jgi:hypothetical protein
MTLARLKVKKSDNHPGLLSLGSIGSLLSAEEVITRAGFRCCDEVVLLTQEHYDELMDDEDIDDDEPEEEDDSEDEEESEEEDEPKEEIIPTAPKSIINQGAKK